MSLLTNKWYYENTAGIILTKEGQSCILSQLNTSDVCPECGAKLTVIGMIEGAFIACSEDMYHARPEYKIDRGDFTAPPVLVRFIGVHD